MSLDYSVEAARCDATRGGQERAEPAEPASSAAAWRRVVTGWRSATGSSRCSATG